ncbi:MAG: DUF4177 domain-containing protein [Firmicutes bacterium]|nr:DUF4177 domain-containing protein [Bacillota bacterium]
MNCIKCEKKLPVDAVFCGHCGTNQAGNVVGKVEQQPMQPRIYQQQPKMKRYEYRTEVIKAGELKNFFGVVRYFDGKRLEMLNAIGREGWKLIEIVQDNPKAGHLPTLELIFMREL